MRNSGLNRGFAKYGAKAAGFFGNKQDKQAVQMAYQQHLAEAAAPAIGYTLGTVGFAGLGLALIARGLHLTK